MKWMLLSVVLLLGCQVSGVSRSAAEYPGEAAIDPVSRNIHHTQGGAIHDSPSLSPPPIRRDLANDR